jgi:hypothetical protein
MGYDSLIKKQVKRAFAAVKDLAKDVVLTQSPPSGFDFATGEATIPAATTKTVKAMVVVKKRKGDVNAAPMTELLMNAEDVSDPTIYTTVTIEGIIWNVVPPYKNDGFTITVEIVRGG